MLRSIEEDLVVYAYVAIGTECILSEHYHGCERIDFIATATALCILNVKQI